jgi:hypothetical protein
MSLNTRKLATAAMMAAVSVVMIYIAGVVPTMKLSLVAIAGVAAALTVAQSGPVYGLMTYGASAILALLLAPASAWMYVVFFGWYPAVKCWVERIDRRWVEWVLKFAAFNAAFFCLWFLLPAVLADVIPKIAQMFWPLFLGANAAFAVYDVGLSGILSYFITKILPKIRKR